MIGDPALYACAGDARIADVDAGDGEVVVTVLGAGERVGVVGWSESPVSARQWSPSAGGSDLAVRYDPTTGKWEAAVEFTTSAWTTLTLHPS